jgi:hypothetical protein
MLQAACYIVCAYLTGMRDCEVQAMRTGCLEVKRSEDGLIERFQVRSTVYKRREVRGQSEKWVTIEPVANAIAVLERLTHHVRQRRGGDTLWRVLDHGRSSKEHVSAEIVRQLNAFNDHLNAQFATADAPIITAGTDGKPWRITTRQFRRTAPLPSRAQFLNVIESVFSGMSRAVIQNSNFENVAETKEAIDRYFFSRNKFFTAHPKRAGRKIWMFEKCEAEFRDDNNCKDERHR